MLKKKKFDALSRRATITNVPNNQSFWLRIRKYKPAECMNQRREDRISSSQQWGHVVFWILLETSIYRFCQDKQHLDQHNNKEGFEIKHKKVLKVYPFTEP